jgi:GNAT superfamily N-acetyltransferase
LAFAINERLTHFGCMSFNESMKIVKIKFVNQGNMEEVMTYLQSHEESSQFLINNLNQYGSKLSDHHNSGNYKILREGSKVVGVFCLSRRGNLLAQTDSDYSDLILESSLKEGIPLKGFIGDWKSMEPIYQLFRKKNPHYQPSYESKEILYSYQLNNEDVSLKHDPRVRFLRAEDFEQWDQFSKAYMEELNLPEDLDLEKRKKDYEARILEKVWWGLFDGDQLLSKTALNSKGEKIGQVGGVFTPKPFRKRGYSKATMLHMLKDCRDLHGHKKSILFTGEEDIPAQKLYESIGYKRIGSFALILG